MTLRPTDLPGAGRAGDEEVRHPLEIDAVGDALDVLAEPERQEAAGVVEGLRLEDVAQVDGRAVAVRHLDAHHALARDGGDDADPRRRQGHGQLLVEVLDPGELHPGDRARTRRASPPGRAGCAGSRPSTPCWRSVATMTSAVLLEALLVDVLLRPSRACRAVETWGSRKTSPFCVKAKAGASLGRSFLLRPRSCIAWETMISGFAARGGGSGEGSSAGASATTMRGLSSSGSLRLRRGFSSTSGCRAQAGSSPSCAAPERPLPHQSAGHGAPLLLRRGLARLDHRGVGERLLLLAARALLGLLGPHLRHRPPVLVQGLGEAGGEERSQVPGRSDEERKGAPDLEIGGHDEGHDGAGADDEGRSHGGEQRLGAGGEEPAHETARREARELPAGEEELEERGHRGDQDRVGRRGDERYAARFAPEEAQGRGAQGRRQHERREPERAIEGPRHVVTRGTDQVRGRRNAVGDERRVEGRERDEGDRDRDSEGEQGHAHDVATHAGLAFAPARLLDPPVGLGLAHGRVESSLDVPERAPAAARPATISGGGGGSIFRRRTFSCADR